MALFVSEFVNYKALDGFCSHSFFAALTDIVPGMVDFKLNFQLRALGNNKKFTIIKNKCQILVNIL